MKLATFDDGSRDGQLLVVARDLTRAHFATGIVTRMQALLDDWNFLAPQLQDLADALDAGKARHALPFDPRSCLAPLPRAFHWARTPTPEGEGPPVLTRHAGDRWQRPQAVISQPAGAAPPQAELVLAAITGELGAELTPEQGLDGIRLLMFGLCWRLHGESDAVATGWAPVALTADELGPGWRGGRLDAKLELRWRGRAVAAADAVRPEARRAHLGQRIAAAAAASGLGSGSIVGGVPMASWTPPAEPTEEAPTPGLLAAELRLAEGLAGFGAIEHRLLTA